MAMAMKSVIITIAVTIASILLSFYIEGLHPKVSIYTLVHMLQIGSHGFFGLGLLTQSSLSSHPPSDYVDVGYFNNLKLKFLYLMRYQLQDNWLWQGWHKSIVADIIKELEARGAKKDEEQTHQIPNFNYDEITPEEFYNKFVRLGRPAIIKNFPIRAVKLWNPDYINDKAGNYSTPMRCGHIVKSMTVSDYMASRFDKNASTTCYLEQGTDILKDNAELQEDLEVHKLSAYAQNKHVSGPGEKIPGYFYSQLFMGLFPSLGITFHCANYNNIFLMVHGRKKWTFVHPAHSFFVYPWYLKLARSAGSLISWHLLKQPNSAELIQRDFPLFRYAPKFEYVMEPGDLLYNPSWNWHMVENLDDESIGVASRWDMPAVYPYNNVLFSLVHFTCVDFWNVVYRNVAKKLSVPLREEKYKAVTMLLFDDLMNFGRVGSLLKHRPTMKEHYPAAYWKSYVEYLHGKGMSEVPYFE